MDAVLKLIAHPNFVPVVLALVSVVVLPVAFIVLKQVYLAVNTARAPDHESESYFDSEDGKKKAFPSIHDAASVTLSVIVPAYNEEKRITGMMDVMLEVLEGESKKNKSFTWEVVVINDGSKDNTAEFVHSTYVKKVGSDKFRLLKLHKNNGKGGAVRKGMVRGRGEYLLMADADGATQASDLTRLLEEIKKVEKGGLGIAIGSRAHMENDAGATASRSPLRRFLMWGFHTFIKIMLGGSKIKDTQCGFKLFSRKAAALLFPVQHIDRWAFDVELVFLATRLRIPMTEVPVHWEEIDGSKIDIVSDSLKMARDIIAIRTAYTIGAWKDFAPIDNLPSPLHGSTEALRCLRTLGADIEARALNGYRPLHCAAHCGHEAIMLALLDLGARADINASSVGGTALRVARSRGHQRVVRVLVARGADLRA